MKDSRGDLGSVGAGRKDGLGRHIIIAGAGAAGLASALVLARAGNRVTLLERDSGVAGRAPSDGNGGPLDLTRPQRPTKVVACSSQNGMSISRYIAAAAARRSRASCRWPTRPVELAEPEVAVRDERAHAQLRGQGGRLPVVPLRLGDVAGPVARRDLAEESPGIRFLASLLALHGEIERAPANGGGLVNPPGEEEGLRPPRGPLRLAPAHHDSLASLQSSVRGAAGLRRPDRQARRRSPGARRSGICSGKSRDRQTSSASSSTTIAAGNRPGEMNEAAGRTGHGRGPTSSRVPGRSRPSPRGRASPRANSPTRRGSARAARRKAVVVEESRDFARGPLSSRGCPGRGSSPGRSRPSEW